MASTNPLSSQLVKTDAQLAVQIGAVPLTGIINLDKPPGPSAAAVLNRIKRLVPRGTKIGHAGTLDPFATGVLLVLVGKATRLCEQLMDQPKRYEATLKLGATTETDDPESPEAPTPGATPPTAEAIAEAARLLVGQVLQRPPIYSALKVGGHRAYDLARRGKPIDLPARPVRIDAIEIVNYEWPLIRMTIDCGRGTYIRSIARDLGERLGVGGYLTALRRTKVGVFTAEEAISVDRLCAEGLIPYLKAYRT
jgi:tRNA pseudouridine55 synthase